uniref:Putative ergic-53 and ergl type 1 transmembrane protein n=2 Tax=Rhipicephalus microplus TaxID=6941 RepID=A0A6M2CPX7_RHIMP|nr:protein ERGIC-53-like [Rhipicephalus microplus]
MAASSSCLWLVVLALLALCSCTANIGHRKFEYKYSFKGPYLAQKDGSVPFWDYSGSCIASEEMVRITPSLKSKKGAIWNKNPVTFPWWEVELVFRVTGQGRLGADGLAFWYTNQRQAEGPVFGSSDKWIGLALFFDSFDNDGKHNNPYIMGMVNDGTKTYEHESDGINQQLGGCQRDFRNKPFPVRAKIEYYQNVLTVLFHNGNTNNDGDYEMCFRAENVFLPQNGYFGVSAATGGLADDHDALKFLTTSLLPEGQQPVATQTIAESEKEKFSREYEQYKDKLERQKEEYRKQHPEEAAKHDMEHGAGAEQPYDSPQQRELRQIFEGQAHMFEGLKAMHRKLDEMLGRQERTLSLVSGIQQSGAAGAVQPQQPGGAPPVHVQSVMQRHEVDSLLNSQRELLLSVQQIKTLAAEVQQKTGTLLSVQQQGGGGGGAAQAALSTEHVQLLHQVQEKLAAFRADSFAQQKLPVTGCATTCLSPTYFLIFSTLQLCVTLGYLMYKSSKEAAAKKFY